MDVVVVLLIDDQRLAVGREIHVVVAAVDGQARRGELPDDTLVGRHLQQPVVPPIGDQDRPGERAVPGGNGMGARAGHRRRSRQRDAAGNNTGAGHFLGDGDRMAFRLGLAPAAFGGAGREREAGGTGQQSGTQRRGSEYARQHHDNSLLLRQAAEFSGPSKRTPSIGPLPLCRRIGGSDNSGRR